MGHDQLFKQVLQAFFAAFLHLFIPDTASRLDLDTAVFRESEAFTDLPQGDRRTADLVAQVRTHAGDPEVVLIHVEVQRERKTGFPARMEEYHSLLRQRERLPVIPIALVLYREGEGIGWGTYTESVFDDAYVTFRFRQISLPLLEAAEYAQKGGALGAALAVLMHLPSRRGDKIAVHLNGLRRVREAQEAGLLDAARAFLLVNLIATYLPLREAERDALQVQLREEGDTTLEATELTWADRLLLQGIEQGREQGREQALREMISRLVQRRFGAASLELEQVVAGLTGEDALTAFFDRASIATDEAALLPTS